MANITFIGLGNMGLPMAKNLIEAGHLVYGFDLSEEQMSQFISAGGSKEENIPDALKKSDTVITMLPSGKHVKSIYMGEDGIIKNANENLLLIDSSTIDVETSREVEKDANNNNLKMLDAPVSGGVTGAEAGTLTFMVGGDTEAFNLSLIHI